MNEQKRPKACNSESERHLDKAEEQFKEFDENIKSMTLDRMNQAPKLETEPQTKMSTSEIDNSKNHYLKPLRAIGSREKFNERFRDDWNFAKEYVQFIAEHKELIGEKIEIWTKKFPGTPAEYWEVPTNKPVWGPRYLAEDIKSRSYHRLKMDQTISSGGDGNGQYYGSMAVDCLINRLDAMPVSSKRSVFMGSNSFK